MHNDRIHQLIFESLELIGTLALRIEKRDRDLARQLRRAAASMALNYEEGRYAGRGNERARWETALGSAAETRTALKVAKAFRYVAAVDEVIDSKLDEVVAMLYRRTH